MINTIYGRERKSYNSFQKRQIERINARMAHIKCFKPNRFYIVDRDSSNTPGKRTTFVFEYDKETRESFSIQSQDSTNK